MPSTPKPKRVRDRGRLGSVVGRRHAGRLIDQIYGFGPTAAVVVWSELGDCRRFSRSRQVVRHTGLDVTVDASDTRRGGGYLSRQGPGTLRWALFEAGLCASRATSPDRDYYRSVKERSDGKLAAICVARKLARRSYHILRAMEPDDVYAIPHLTHPGSVLSASVVGNVHLEHHALHGQLPPSGGSPASRAGRPSNTDATAAPSSPAGVTPSRLLSPTRTPSSSTQETQDAPTPPPAGPYRARTGPRAGQGCSSSLRCRALHLDRPLRIGARPDQGLDTPHPTQETPAVASPRAHAQPMKAPQVILTPDEVMVLARPDATTAATLPASLPTSMRQLEVPQPRLARVARLSSLHVGAHARTERDGAGSMGFSEAGPPSTLARGSYWLGHGARAVGGASSASVKERVEHVVAEGQRDSGNTLVSVVSGASTPFPRLPPRDRSALGAAPRDQDNAPRLTGARVRRSGELLRSDWSRSPPPCAPWAPAGSLRGPG